MQHLWYEVGSTTYSSDWAPKMTAYRCSKCGKYVEGKKPPPGERCKGRIGKGKR